MRDGAPPPPELKLAWQCERWKTLPDAGGIYDQDHKVMTTMSALLNVHGAVSAWMNLTGENIHKMSDHDRKILRYLLDNGIEFNVSSS